MIHAVPLDVTGDHRPDRSCKCGPIAHRDIGSASKAVILVHRIPPTRDERRLTSGPLADRTATGPHHMSAAVVRKEPSLTPGNRAATDRGGATHEPRS